MGSDPELDGVSTLLREHRARLCRVARAEGLAAEDALDCVQEAFATFLGLRHADAIAARADDAARVLTVIARNAARNRRRRRYLAAPHDADPATLEAQVAVDPPSDERVARVEDELRLEACVGRLGDLQRRVLTLRLLEERPGEDVAQLLGLTPGHVAVLLHRAKRSLRLCMECGDAPPEGDAE